MSLASGHPPRLLDQVREVIRIGRYSIHTEQADVPWVQRSSQFHGKPPREMAAPELTAFLCNLAAKRNVAAATEPSLARGSLLVLASRVGCQAPERSHHAPEDGLQGA